MEIVCDLILLSWNNLEQTRSCLESLFEVTRLPSRLFIVDNGSEPPVRHFLASVKPRGFIRDVTLLQNERNEGFPRGMNRGIAASTAPFVCLLNNDLRFASGWLREMVAVATADPSVGIVNPTSNTFGDHPPAGWSLEEYAAARRQYHGQYVEVGMCIGFCLLVKRDVLNRIGTLSEDVERFFFEDEDFSMRAQQAGFQCVVAQASYVHHAEHRSVSLVPERETVFQRNQRWCHEKWGRWVRVAWPRFTPPVPGSEELRAWLTRVRRFAQRRTHVYVYCPTPAHVTRDELFRSVGLVPHADVHWHSIPSVAADWVAMGWILKRRKKRFDLIVAPDHLWGRAMEGLGWLHRAAVIPEDHEEQLIHQWHVISRSLSSS